MSTKALSRSVVTPSLFDEFFKPWNEWFDEGKIMNRTITVPAVNIKEKNNHYSVSLAAPGLKRNDFKISLESNMLTISSEKEEKHEEKDDMFTRKEYNYTSFSRCFTLPEDVKQDEIKAHYEDGVLTITLPRKENGKTLAATKTIAVN